MNKFSWYVPNVGGVFILLALMLAGALVGNIVSLIVTVVMKGGGMDVMTVISYPVMFLPALIFAWSKSRNGRMWSQGHTLDANNFKPLGGGLAALLVTAGTVAMGFVCDAVSSFMPDMPAWLHDALDAMTNGNVWLNFLSVSIMAPLFEEWLCRGMILRGLLVKGVKPVWAIVVSAFIFAFIHLNPWQAIPAFMLGLLFGYVYYRTGSLKLTMLMHFTNNTLALVVSQTGVFGDAQSWTEVLGEKYWIFFAISLIVTVLVWLAFRRVVPKHPYGNFDTLPALSEK